MRLLTSGIVALLGTAGLSALLAQSVDGVDVQAVKKRAADMAAEAQAFVDQVKDRGDEFREQANVVRKSGIDASPSFLLFHNYTKCSIAS